MTTSELLQIMPCQILTDYIIDTLSTMTRPSLAGDWPLFTVSMPDTADTNCGCVYDTPGVKDGRHMRDGLVIEHHGLQLRIRSREPDIGYIKAEEIAKELDTVHNDTITINGTDYTIQNISRQGPVIPLGPEIDTTKRRFLFTVNFLMTVKRII